MSDNTETQQPEVQFQIHKLYIKDMSFEVPEGAKIFNKPWKPELNVSLNTNINKLEEADTYEIVLTVEADVKCDGQQAFKAEVQQAGIFNIANMADQQLDHAQYAFCPNILYPYAREAVSDLVARGGFPQLCLAPVNFDMLYQHKKQEANS
ncbi:MAG: protein-export chaperone SecB [Francisellaceae bacterium]